MSNWYYFLFLLIPVGVVAFMATRPSFVVGVAMNILERLTTFVWDLIKNKINWTNVFKYTPPANEEERKERARKKAYEDMSRR